MNQKVLKKLEFFIKLLEVFICIIVLAAVISGVPDLIMYVINTVKSKDVSFSYQIINEFLKHALLLVVGIELVEMIITRSHESVLTLILFVIARKMLVYSDGMVDILLGTISISLIFVIIRFVLKDEKLMATLDNTFSASMPVKKINREYNLKVPIDMSNTLGGLIYELAKIENVEIKENSSFVYGGYIYKVISMKEGVIQRIRIDENI
ncbi:MAG: transporter associated domain-containing protein [Peptoniphilaceae bacterium]|nr:transporter associated domain-containing protein [Peptoniphilaceae bacterium]MDY6018441.1 transporter associated domain-containing protein [Anaerococcus sp.]